MTRVVRAVYARFGLTLTKKKLGQALPVVGIVVGAGLNAATVSGVAEAAENLYRERFLREKYGIAEDTGTVVVAAVDEDVVDVAEILEAEIVDEAGPVHEIQPVDEAEPEDDGEGEGDGEGDRPV